MSRLTAVFLAAFSLVACASSHEDAAESSAAVSSVAAAVESVGADVERKSHGHDYLVTDRFTDAELPGGAGAAVSGRDRLATLSDCAVYGGGASARENRDEDLVKYLSAAEHDELARALLASVGSADIYRIDSFGIGDPGDEYSSRCTAAIRVEAGALLVLQGHGRDEL